MWNSYLRGIGHLIIFSNDFQTHEASAHKAISTLCVEHSLDGFPRFDLMMAKMEHMQPDGVVAVVNTDVEVTRSGMGEVVWVTKWIENKQPLDAQEIFSTLLWKSWFLYKILVCNSQ
jgi:hypothetical protein